MEEKKKGLFEKGLLNLLYYINGNASLKDAFFRFFLPCYVSSLLFRFIFVKQLPYLLPASLTIFILHAFTILSFLSLIVLWRCAKNLSTKTQFYLVRAITGLLIFFGLIIVVYI